MLTSEATIAQSYNYKTALEAYQTDDNEKALDYFKRELIDRPNSAMSAYYIAKIESNNENYGIALKSINSALLYLPKKDTKIRSKAYAEKGKIEHFIGNSEKAVANYGVAIQLNPKNFKLYIDRAEFYYQLKQFKKSDADYQSILAMDESFEMAWAGLGRNCLKIKELEKAEQFLTKSINLNSNYSYAYEVRSEVYFDQKKFNKAIIDVLVAVDLEKESAYLQDRFLNYSVSNFPLALAEVNERIKNQPFDEFWNTIRAKLYNQNGKYKLAIKEFDHLIKYIAQSINLKDLLAERGNAYTNAGLYKKAISDYSAAIAIDSTDSYILSKRANAHRFAKDYQNAILDLTKSMEIEPKENWNYYMRGWIYDEMLKDTLKGLNDYNTAIAIDENYSYSYLMRARMFKEKLQNPEKSNEDFQKILSLETEISESGNCRQYALFHLGRNEEALAWLNQILTKYPTEGNYYDATCLYALMNKPTQALEALRISFEKGNTNFNHIAMDDDINSIRNNPEFIALYTEWSEKVKKENEMSETVTETTPVNSTPRTIFISLTAKDGVFEIPCKLNDLKLDFVLDTGAADISISQTELNFMLKNNYLSEKDFIGKGNYVLANGESQSGRIVNIKKVEIGGLVLFNVKASVVENQKASLLFGQTALNRYGKFEIDNKRNTLKIELIE